MDKLVLLMLIGMLSMNLTAQHNQFNIGTNAGIGASWVEIHHDDVSTKLGVSVNVQVFAEYYFSEYQNRTGHWGINLGLGVNQCNSTLDLGSLEGVFNEGDDPTGYYQMLLYSNGLQERVQSTILSIPIGVVYKKDLNRFIYMRTLLGLNIEVPLVSSYGRGEGSLSTRMYYPAYMVGPIEAIKDIPEFGCYENYSEWDNSSGSMFNQLNLSLFFQTGFVYRLDRKVRPSQTRVLKLTERRRPLLTVDFYLGFGFNKETNDASVNLLEPGTSNNYIYHSVTTLYSTHTMHSGIKLGMLFGGKRRYYCR